MTGRRLAVGVLMAFMVAGCSPSRRPSDPPMSEAWRLRSISPIGQAVAVGGMVVVYGTENKDLYLYGVAVADGSVRWRQAASPGAVVSGIEVVPNVIDERVAYFRPDAAANLAARLVVASPDTGADLLVSGPFRYVSRPRQCDDGKDICLSSADNGAPPVSKRFSVEAGGPVPDTDAAPAGSRSVGDGLLDLGQRQPEILAGFRDGKVQWRSPLTSYFSPGHSTDKGWYFERYAPGALDVGSVGRAADQEDGATVVFDLSKEQTVAIDAATGSLAWREDGTRFACDGKIALSRTVADGRSEPWPVRCRYRGLAHYKRPTEGVFYEGLDVTVEGFDVTTGKTTWSVLLGAAEAFLRDDARAIAVSDTEVLVQAATGGVVVDVATGVTRPPHAGEVFLCGKGVIFQYREARLLPDGKTANTWRGGTLLSPCVSDGSPATAAPRQVARSIGATVGDRTVVADAGGLVAYDRGGR
jgi:outer membrane protein assembly factor BamB